MASAQVMSSRPNVSIGVLAARENNRENGPVASFNEGDEDTAGRKLVVASRRLGCPRHRLQVLTLRGTGHSVRLERPAAPIVQEVVTGHVQLSARSDATSFQRRRA